MKKFGFVRMVGLGLFGLSLLQNVAPPFAQAETQSPDVTEERVSVEAIVAGGALAWFVGLGTGQAVQGRFGSSGWIFLVGETISLGALIGGVYWATEDQRRSTGLIPLASGGAIALGALGTLSFLAFRVVGIVDAIVTPFAQNARVDAREGRNLTSAPRMGIAPILDDRGVGAFAALQWRF